MDERYYGFDLGDAESAVARLSGRAQSQPDMLLIADKQSCITAYAVLENGDIRIGENACYEPAVRDRKLRFKSRFLTERSTEKDVQRFAAGVLGELRGDGELLRDEDATFTIGCPAGWGKNDRERYREIFERTGYPPVKIISESRAALVSACQSRHLQLGYDILSKPVLVVDIGSSTTDFAYVCGGKEVDIHTAGEVKLGGGIMDEILMQESMQNSMFTERLKTVFEKSEQWKNYCEFAARRLKEKYFSDEEYWSKSACKETVLIRYDFPVRLTLEMNAKTAASLTEKKVDALGGKSFREVFEKSLRDVRDSISGPQPELVFLTGGVSRMPIIRTWCEQNFPDAVVIRGAEPEFSVAKGLAWCGQIDAEMRDFRLDLEELKNSTVVEDIVLEQIEDLYRMAVDTLAEPILKFAAEPVYERWRNGEIKKLGDVSEEMQHSIETWLHSDAARELLVKPITEWLRPVSDRLEEYTVPICIKHKVPYSAMKLGSYLDASDVSIEIEAESVFAIKEITWLIDSMISVIVGLLCGGNGIALIAGGVPGIIVGFMASFVLLLLGRKQFEKALLKMNLPKPLRKLMPKDLFGLRGESVIAKVREGMYEKLENEKNEEITARMVSEISGQIEECLTRMAEVVEIPLTI